MDNLLLFNATAESNWAQRIAITLTALIYIALIAFVIQQNFMNQRLKSEAKGSDSPNTKLALFMLLFIISNLFMVSYIHIIVYYFTDYDCHTIMSICIGTVWMTKLCQYLYLFARVEVLFTEGIGFHYSKKFMLGIKVVLIILFGSFASLCCSNYPTFTYVTSMSKINLILQIFRIQISIY